MPKTGFLIKAATVLLVAAILAVPTSLIAALDSRYDFTLMLFLGHWASAVVVLLGFGQLCKTADYDQMTRMRLDGCSEEFIQQIMGQRYRKPEHLVARDFKAQ